MQFLEYTFCICINVWRSQQSAVLRNNKIPQVVENISGMRRKEITEKAVLYFTANKKKTNSSLVNFCEVKRDYLPDEDHANIVQKIVLLRWRTVKWCVRERRSIKGPEMYENVSSKWRICTWCIGKFLLLLETPRKASSKTKKKIIKEINVMWSEGDSLA